MRRFAIALAVAGVTLFCSSVAAQADPSEYDIQEVGASASTVQAGAHPDFKASVQLKKDAKGKLPSRTRDFIFDLPPGLVGNPNAIPKCTTSQLVGTDISNPSNETGCPQASQVGVVQVELFDSLDNPLKPIFEPVYNMEPGEGEPARLGFIGQVFPILIRTRLRSDGDYGVTAIAEGGSAFVSVASAANTIWGVPAAKSHDSQRITPYEAIHNEGEPEEPGGKRPSGLVPTPFMSNPTRCGVAQGVDITAIPYVPANLEAEMFAPMTPNSSCELLDFSPQMSILPTTTEANSGAGLDVELTFPQEGLENPNVTAEAAQKKVAVTLPEGVTVNPSQAVGLEACTEAEFERETASSPPGAGCPEASKVGSLVAHSPLLDEAAEGSLFVAKPYANPFGTLIALYMVFKIPDRGIVVKLPAKVEVDPQTGQLTTTVDEIPQLPVASFQLHFRSGPRSPLVTPAACGTYKSTATFTSWADPANPVTLRPGFEIDRGSGGGPCPSGVPPFHPGFSAGALSDTAGAFSPYQLRFTRNDDEQELTKFSVTMPPGVVAKLAGVSRCSDEAIAAARSRSGSEELASPSCPASSEIGQVLGGAGVGPVLTYASGKLYLAGPYNGDPLSVVAIVPAVAGPFDVGTIVTRQALRLDPDTGQAQVDGANSDPVPHILAGIPLRVRDVRASVNRPSFTLNPTDCEPLAFQASVWGGGLDPFSTADDAPQSVASRFQVADCGLLGFKPQLSLKLSGTTHRGGHPALRAVLRPRAGDANIASAQVTLPRSEFIEQSHFRTICTRVQFAANQCPAGSVYGHVTAFSPLLDEPLAGPVYLRSSSHQLPDVVFALHGIVDINVVGRVDSIKGRLRTTFESVPDAPVSKAVLTMQGGQKGLFVNSTNLCAGTQRATADFAGQNGKTRSSHPVVDNSCRSGGGGRKRKGGGR
jgi:hypothetical protein